LTNGAATPIPLGRLFPDVELPATSRDLPIAGLTADSRAAGPGFLFAALPGVKADGLQFAPAARAAGAVAVLTESTQPVPEGMVAVRVRNARASLARAAAAFHPRQPAVVTAVTGTNGKTSVASFTRQIWASLGHPAASLGTVGLVSPSGDTYSNLTTPDPVALHRIMQELAQEGVTHLALEASSHGLDQSRLCGVRLAAGGFTNLTRDHLDYHASFNDYRAAKLKLFTQVLPEGAPAVICVDGPYAGEFHAAAEQHGQPVVTVGARGDGIRLIAHEPAGFAQRLTLGHDGREYGVLLPLAGTFQAENALVAAGLAIATGSEPAAVFAALEGLKGASGRLERVATHNGAEILVDYAHTPDALENAILALKPYASGRLIVVFGAGGDRDPGKRPLMGAVVARHADAAIVTDDNPRSEDPSAIRRQILEAAPHAHEIGDRRDAIATAIGALRQGDVLLVAGKGHETGQIVGDRVLPFSDHAAILAAVEGAR
jgi:UDP-N-acetylmuramoyl-L-alanyl-D-glutamate--2,6-diaminopimelate ligase